ncbi:hypothetical protein BN946_scf184684.g1 [Trametes cinnabarina]|uniref:F-box domain-containing protein n=1 Tax=Pycnoporus cinnabarinus TaxID=5643 RepID=A0A060SU92_PYCCI|nr:hypothetical protein BN946_scf184684.g1 [Trametes cinnabarina]
MELVHNILQDAWFSMLEREWSDRWAFYRNVFLVSRTWRDDISIVALRYVMIQTAQDFAVYRKLVIRRWGVDPDSPDIECVAPAARDFFQRSELHVVVSEWTCPSSTGFQFATDYARIPSYIPSCKHISIIIKELPSNDDFIRPYEPLFEFLSPYTSTKELYLLWTYTHINRYILPSARVCGVTYLRIHEYPRCICHSNRHVAGHKHDGDCLSYHLPTLFPNLKHLHLDTPYILKCLAIPPSVTQLTLEAPQIHHLPSRGHFSSLMGWNIVSALSLGLFKRDSPDAPRKKIVVNSGPDEPAGWARALAACEAHDVVLELHRVYPPVDSNTDPPPP